MNREVIKAVLNEEPTDANCGGWDILISVPDRDGEPSWCCIAETKDPVIRDAMLYALDGADFVLSSLVRQQEIAETPGIEGILERKRRGIDCTEDESVEVLNYFTDNAQSLLMGNYPTYDQVVQNFPLEWDQWLEDRKW